MKIEEALRILIMIQDGQDPYNLDTQKEGVPENNPITVRALCIAVASLIKDEDKEKLFSYHKNNSVGKYANILNGPLRSYMEEIEKKQIVDMLDEVDYDEKRAADKLGMSVMELFKNINKYKIGAMLISKKYLSSGLEYNLKQFIDNIEKNIIIEAMQLSNHIQTKAANILGISYKAIRIRIKKHKINRNSYPSYKFASYYINCFEIMLLDKFLFDIEKTIIGEVMKITGGKVVRAANFLGMKHTTLSMKIKKQITSEEPNKIKTNQNDRWEIMFKELLCFYKKFNHCNVPDKWPENPKLGSWVSQQRNRYVNGKLREDRYQRFKEIGFEMNLSVSNWDKKYRQLLLYKNENGNCNVPGNKKKYSSLSGWVQFQRSKKKINKLTRYQIRKLEEIGFIWDIRQDSWDKMYKNLVQYQKLNGHCAVPEKCSENPKLGIWVKKQKYYMKQGKLKKERIEHLNSIKFKW